MDKQIEAALIVAAGHMAASMNKMATNFSQDQWTTAFHLALEVAFSGYALHTINPPS